MLQLNKLGIFDSPGVSFMTDREELLKIILNVSFEKKNVTLASGRKSDFYLDLRQVFMRPRGLELVGRLTIDKLVERPLVSSVGGMAVGAVPYVAAVLAAAVQNPKALDLLGFFVRKEAKKHGLGKRIEGAFLPGHRVALLEDTTTTGSSTLQAAELVEAEGGIVERIICVVDRGEGAKEAFAEKGFLLEPLFSRLDLPV